MTPHADDPHAHAALRADIEEAARCLPALWPISSFIAVNPLGGLEHLDFEDAGARAAQAHGAHAFAAERDYRALHRHGRITTADLHGALLRRLPGLAALDEVRLGEVAFDPADVLVLDLLQSPPAGAPAIRPAAAERADRAHGTRAAAIADREAAAWCGAFLDEGQAAWPMPGRDRGLYGAWRTVARHDRGLARGLRRRIADLPETPEAAVLEALERLGVAPGERAGELERHLARLSGWAGAIAWRRRERPDGAGAPADLADLLAVQLSLEALLVDGTPPPPPAPVATGDDLEARALAVVRAAGAPEDCAASAEVRELLALLAPADRLAVWQEAYEEHLRAPLLARLGAPARPATLARPAAQAVFCIDVRSEVLRRHLEARGAYETLGFAGFFGVAMRFRPFGSAADDALCPVLLTPGHEVTERLDPEHDGRARRWLLRRRRSAALGSTAKRLGEDPGAPFAFAEASGWLMGPAALARTLAPGALGPRARHEDHPPARVDVSAFSHEEQIGLAIGALRMMGLVRGFGRLVLLCAHGSHTTNNPFASALDCGACGGNAGGPNARALAEILNLPHVRDALRLDGIEVPEDTWFLAGLHDTTADRVTILDRDLVPAGHRPDLERLEADLAAAGARTSAERLGRLPDAPAGLEPEDAARHAARRGRDWAQIRPEWGLAGCAAFIVGPRALTHGHDLAGRTFLHSYDPAADTDGSALETILTAPLIVAHWISSAYYFAAVAPQVFSSGNKTLHNVVAGLGVLEGPGGDLRAGLPLQAAFDGDRPVHEPVRLLAVVQAPLAQIDDIIARNPGLGNLVRGGWIALAAREDAGEPWMRRGRDGGWEAWLPQDRPADAPRPALELA